jgi:hypothetical protein
VPLSKDEAVRAENHAANKARKKKKDAEKAKKKAREAPVGIGQGSEGHQ